MCCDGLQAAYSNQNKAYKASPCTKSQWCIAPYWLTAPTCIATIGSKQETIMKPHPLLSACAWIGSFLLMACSPAADSASKPAKPLDTTAQKNGYTADFEKQYVAQCLTEQTSVNVDTKVYCLCMGSFVVRDTQASEFMPVWQAHLAGNTNAEQTAQLAKWAETAKKQRGCRIEKF